MSSEIILHLHESHLIQTFFLADPRLFANRAWQLESPGCSGVRPTQAGNLAIMDYHQGDK